MEKREAEIKAIRANLLKELKELKSARCAIEGGDAESGKKQTATNSLTIKQMVLSILKDAPKGLAPHNIIDRINQEFKVEVVRSSLSPQLSRLKADGKLNRDEENGIWKLPDVVNPRKMGHDLIGADNNVSEYSPSRIRQRPTDRRADEPDESEDLI